MASWRNKYGRGQKRPREFANESFDEHGERKRWKSDALKVGKPFNYDHFNQSFPDPQNENVDGSDDEDLEPTNRESVPFYKIGKMAQIGGSYFEKGRWVPATSEGTRFQMKGLEGDTTDRFRCDWYLKNKRTRTKFVTRSECAEIEVLSSLVKRGKPPRNVNPVALLQAAKMKSNFDAEQKRKGIGAATAENPQGLGLAMDILSMAGEFEVPQLFEELSISNYTKYCLRKKGFVYLTDIQKVAIPHALVGRDVLGAAKTGSGKTLSFVIPVLENLYRKAWNKNMGVGALMLAPTRELAMQIYHTLTWVGRRIRHLSVGLLVGGNHSDFDEERSLIHKLSILVGTPGRVCSHFERTNRFFHVDKLQMLVLDEADMMLDIGLLDQVQRIIGYLPRKRQTMLYSATLTVDIVKLAKVALRRPVFLPIDTADACALPKELVQSYLVTPMEHKYNVLWSFIQTHVDDKMIIFFATLRQVKFTRRVFLALRPFASMCCLHSEMKQTKRIEMYEMFKRCRSRVMMLCTEVASRGLDFGNIDWVINFDVPTDTKSYIHRCGRAARLGQRGNSITFLAEHERGFIKQLKRHNIVCKKLGVHSNNLRAIRGVLTAMLTKDARMMALAESAFCSYLAHYYFHGNEDYMDPNQLNKDQVARNFGLMITPKYKKFLKKCKAHKLKQLPDELKELLLDTKRKRKQKAELLRIAEEKKEKEEAEALENGDGAIDKKKRFEEEAPKWFASIEDSFGDKTSSGLKDDAEDEEIDIIDQELNMEKEEESEEEEGDIEEQALAALLNRD